jgi:hypothetical protein
MRPKMPDIVSIMTPTGEIDRFGRNVTTETVSSARVTPLITTIQTADGTTSDVAAEIDLPPEVVVGHGTRIKFYNQFKVWQEADVLRLEPTNDLANHVLFWTVQVG